MRVKKLLNSIGHDVDTISPGARVYDAMELMGKKEVGAIVVVDKEKMVGILSEQDYARKIILKGKNSRETTVREIMTADVIHTSPDKKLQKCLSLMMKNRIHHLPVLEKVLADPAAKALYLFPLKALAQDQLRAFEEMAACCGGAISPAAEIYDGDTSAWHRKRIRQNPPNVLMTNPEMLHLSFLAHHPKWSDFFSGLQMVVVDEVHTYRGILGSHMAQLFRRLQRVCAFYGASPTFVFSSATVANPGQLVDQLTGLEVQTIAESGAPQGRRHVVFVNPPDGPVQTAIQGFAFYGSSP